MGAVQAPKESLHWKSTLAEKSHAAPGSKICVSSMLDPILNQLSYISTPPGIHFGNVTHYKPDVQAGQHVAPFQQMRSTLPMTPYGILDAEMD